MNKSNQLLGSKVELVFMVGNRYHKLKAGQCKVMQDGMPKVHEWTAFIALKPIGG